MNVRLFPSFFSMPIYLFSKKTKGGHPTFEIFFSLFLKCSLYSSSLDLSSFFSFFLFFSSSFVLKVRLSLSLFECAEPHEEGHSHLCPGPFSGVPCDEIGTAQGFRDRWLGQTLKLNCLPLIGRMCQYLQVFTLYVWSRGPWDPWLHSWEAAEPEFQSGFLTHQPLYHAVSSITFKLHLRWIGTLSRI